MSVDLAVLGIKIDSTSAATATKDLAGLEGQSRKVETATQSMASGFDKLQRVIVSLASAYGLLKLEQHIQDAALLAARVETLGVVMTQVGKNAFYSATEMQAYADSVRKMGITTQESRQTVTQFVQAHLDLAKSAQLARVAQDAAVIGGQNSSEAMRGLMHGITTLQPEILRTYGIIVNFEAEYARFAAATGRTTESLSSQEKQTIALNSVLAAGTGISGSYEAAMGTVGKQITTLPRLIEEARLQFGELFKPALGVLVTEFANQLKRVSEWLAELKKNGTLDEWGQGLATNITGAIEKAIALAKGIKDVADTFGPFAVEAGKLLILGAVADRVLSLVTNVGKLGAAIRANKEVLVFLAAYEATTAFTAWVDGTNKIITETEEETAALKRQKEILKQRTAAAYEDNAARTAFEDSYTKQFMEDMRKLIAAEDGRIVAEQQKRDAAMKAQIQRDQSYLKKWQTEKETIGKSGLERESALLDVEYAAYKRVVDDKVALEEWFAWKKRDIQLKANNELLAIMTELYQATGNSKYLDTATTAIETIVDAEYEANKRKGLDEDGALFLREKHYQEYVSALKGKIQEKVKDERKAADEIVAITKRQVEEQLEAMSAMRQGAQPASSGGISGMPYLPGGIYQPFYDLVSGKTATDQAAYRERMNQIAEEAARRAEESLQAQEAYQQEQQRLWDEQIAANKRLNESLRDQSMTIQSWLASLQTGSLSPVQSNGFWGQEYNRLKGIANTPPVYDQNNKQIGGATSADLSNFLSYAKDFMSYAKTSGTTGSYSAVYDMITKDVQAMGKIANIGDILSGMGLGQTETDIRKVITAFNDMGVATSDLNAYLTAYSAVVAGNNGATATTEQVRAKMEEMARQSAIAAGTTGGLSTTLDATETPFSNVQKAINAFTATGLGSLDSALSSLAVKLGIAFTPGVGTAAGAALISQYTSSGGTAATHQISEAWIGKGINPYNGAYMFQYIPNGQTYWLMTDPVYAQNAWWANEMNHYTKLSMGWKNMTTGSIQQNPPTRGYGGLMVGPTIGGEMGPEWAVPTYEPQRSNFLRDVGADPVVIGNTIADRLAGSLAGMISSGDGEVHVHLHLNEREIQTVVAKGMKTNNDLRESTRRAVQ